MSHEPVRPGRPEPKDFLGIDSLLDDDERLIRDTVRQFVADRVLPDIGELISGYDHLARHKADDGPVEGHLRLGAVPSVITVVSAAADSRIPTRSLASAGVISPRSAA